MIQTKHLYCDDAATKGMNLDEQINQFIVDKTKTNRESEKYFVVKDIKHSTSTIEGERPYFTFSALVIYEEGDCQIENTSF